MRACAEISKCFSSVLIRHRFATCYTPLPLISPFPQIYDRISLIVRLFIHTLSNLGFMNQEHAQGIQGALPPQFETPQPPPFPQAHLGDHAYCSNPYPVLNKTRSNGSPEQDPGGFLNKDFSVGEVNTMIRNLGNNKTAGHDDLINEALKEAPPVFYPATYKVVQHGQG